MVDYLTFDYRIRIIDHCCNTFVERDYELVVRFAFRFSDGF